jgi:hypothetical protein
MQDKKNNINTLNITINLFFIFIIVSTITNYECTFGSNESKGTSVMQKRMTSQRE